MPMTWAGVRRELIRLGADPGDPLVGPEPPDLVAAVQRNAADLKDAGCPPPERVISSRCGKGPVVVWDTGEYLDAFGLRFDVPAHKEGGLRMRRTRGRKVESRGSLLGPRTRPRVPHSRGDQ